LQISSATSGMLCILPNNLKIYLLQELLSQTPSQHADYDSLQRASQLIGETVITINEKKREAEEQAVMIQLQKDLDGLKKVNISSFLMLNFSF